MRSWLVAVLSRISAGIAACNTAAADGTPGAEGLSGLAKAFFYAGSRALLVSHWPVASDAADALGTPPRPIVREGISSPFSRPIHTAWPSADRRRR